MNAHMNAIHVGAWIAWGKPETSYLSIIKDVIIYKGIIHVLETLVIGDRNECDEGEGLIRVEGDNRGCGQAENNQNTWYTCRKLLLNKINQ